MTVTTAYQHPPAQLDDPFRIYVPIAIAADMLSKADGAIPPVVQIRTLASTEHRDLQKERVRQDGINWDWFKAFGRLTWGHPYAPERVIGTPTAINPVVCEDGTPGHELVGNLWTTTTLGRQAYELHKAAIAAGDRGLGASIEGNAIERNPSDRTEITKAIVYHVALDPSPVNQQCFALPFEAIGKALGFLAKGATLDDSMRKALGPDGDMVVQLLKAFVSELAPRDPRTKLIKGRTERDLRALAVLVRHPDLSLRDAHSFVDDPEGFVAEHNTRTP